MEHNISTVGHSARQGTTDGLKWSGVTINIHTWDLEDGDYNYMTDTATFNPKTIVIGDGTKPWHTYPGVVSLGHELVHAWRSNVCKCMNYTPDPANEGRLTEDELETVGLKGDFRYTENKIRSDLGYLCETPMTPDNHLP